VVRGNRYYQTIATINSPRDNNNSDKKWVLFCMVVGASVVASTRRRTFHKRIQCIQSELFQAAFFGGLPRFRLVGESDVPPSPTSSWGEVGLGFGGLPRLRFAGGSPVGLSSGTGTFLGCINHGESAPGGAWGRGRGELRRSSAEHTLGGLPLFLFSPAAGATSDVEAAVPAALFLFLLPLGRPRPRFAGVVARPKGGTIGRL